MCYKMRTSSRATNRNIQTRLRRPGRAEGVATADELAAAAGGARVDGLALLLRAERRRAGRRGRRGRRGCPAGYDKEIRACVLIVGANELLCSLSSTLTARVIAVSD